MAGVEGIEGKLKAGINARVGSREQNELIGGG